MINKQQIEENLRRSNLEPELIKALIDLAISEDLMGGSDVTSLSTIPETQKSQLDLVSRKEGLVAGIEDRKSTRLNSSHIPLSRMPSSA